MQLYIRISATMSSDDDVLQIGVTWNLEGFASAETETLQLTSIDVMSTEASLLDLYPLINKISFHKALVYSSTMEKQHKLNISLWFSFQSVTV